MLFVIYFTFLSNLQVPQFENLDQVISDQDASSSWKAHDSGVPKVKCLKSYVDKIQFEKYENFWVVPFVKKSKMLNFIFSETKFSFRWI